MRPCRRTSQAVEAEARFHMDSAALLAGFASGQPETAAIARWWAALASQRCERLRWALGAR